MTVQNIEKGDGPSDDNDDNNDNNDNNDNDEVLNVNGHRGVARCNNGSI